MTALAFTSPWLLLGLIAFVLLYVLNILPEWGTHASPFPLPAPHPSTRRRRLILRILILEIFVIMTSIALSVVTKILDRSR